MGSGRLSFVEISETRAGKRTSLFGDVSSGARVVSDPSPPGQDPAMGECTIVCRYTSNEARNSRWARYASMQSGCYSCWRARLALLPGLPLKRWPKLTVEPATLCLRLDTHVGSKTSYEKSCAMQVWPSICIHPGMAQFTPPTRFARVRYDGHRQHIHIERCRSLFQSRVNS